MPQTSTSGDPTFDNQKPDPKNRDALDQRLHLLAEDLVRRLRLQQESTAEGNTVSPNGAAGVNSR